MAKRKIIISEYDNIATLMEDDRAIEFIIHRGDMLLGDVYLCSVENILPSIDAAFVNVGGDKMGFLHSSDVPGKGDLKERLEPKQQLVVQIMKEPTGHKGPRVSTNISLPGRFLVMMPESKGISISRRITETAERSRLKSVVSLIKPPGVGVIIRTEAANQKESDITEDFEILLERWQSIVSMADTATPPTLLYRDQDLLYRVIREAVTEDVTEIVVDSAFGQQRAQQLLQNWNMDKGVKVTQHQGNQPILVGTGVDKEIKLALQTKVPLPSGGYLYIQPTEALTVVDVNSGKFTSLHSQAETIKQTNLEACKEIARQLRLRNVGGMIIVDFIDMESRANQLVVLQTFENELAPDKAKPQIGQLSDLGLVEMTRHRQGQSLSEIFTRRCTTCSGTGHAIDELSWMHTGSEGEGRGRQGRNKLPMRQPNRMQPVPKPAASLSQRKDKTRVALGNLADGGQKKEPQTSVTPGNILLNRLDGGKAALPAPETESWLEHFQEKVYKAFGARFATVVKLSYMPTAINGVLTRINPKANDIVTLVHSIESAGTAIDASMDEGESTESDFDDEETAPEEPSEEEGPSAKELPRRGGGRARMSDAAAAAREAEREAAEREETEDEEPLTAEPDLEEVVEVEAEFEEESGKSRRGRAMRREESDEEAMDDSRERSGELEPELDEEEGDDFPAAEDDAGDVGDFDKTDDADTDAENHEPESAVAVIKASGGPQAKRRKGGRPAKRVIKKPSKR